MCRTFVHIKSEKIRDNLMERYLAIYLFFEVTIKQSISKFIFVAFDQITNS